MTEVPKIVHSRLRAAEAAERAHPEADALAAFAEQTLSPTEREGVLEHLALCGECRDVVALSLPPVESAAATGRAEEAEREAVPVRGRSQWFAWPTLRWAALAAGIAVAVLIVRPGLEHWGKPKAPVSSVAKQTAPPATLPSNTPTAAGIPPERSILADTAAAKPTDKTEAPRQLSSHKQRPAPAAPLASGAPVGMLVAGNLKKDSGRLDVQAAPPPSARALDAPKSMNEVVAVSGTAGTVSGLSADDKLMAKVEAPAIEKAKPARDEVGAKEEQYTATASMQARKMPQAMNRMVVTSETRSKTALKVGVIWSIAGGVLRRSLDGGQSWQTAVKAEHALLCYANQGQDVWAGGQAGTLLHSSDGGATWSTVPASFQAQSLKSDITHIEMRGLTEIVFATADQQTWSSTDSGKTWEKK